MLAERIAGLALAIAVASGCGGNSTDEAATGGEGSPDASTDAPADAATDAATDAAPDVAKKYLSCFDEPPAGAAEPPALPTYAGTCPTLVAAPAENTITTSGADRKFLLAVPSDVKPAEKLPVIFLWHWLGGSADGFYTKGEVQAAVDQQRFIAVIPIAKGDLQFKWPFTILDSQARQDEEFAFFDDMLACVAAQYPNVVRHCVASAGVSAGALFTDQLAGKHGERLSSFLSLSGGVDGYAQSWGSTSHGIPAMVLWGGPSDTCVTLNFETASLALESYLTAENHFMVECIHNCAHSEPPFAPPTGNSKYAGLWQFVFDHPYWLAAGDSPYLTKGIPATDPAWCGIGPGSAVIRDGVCDPPSCPF